MRKALKATRLIGLLALLTSFMAFSASAAQAEWTWLKGGAAITEFVPIQAKADKELVLLTKVGLSKVEILCTEMKLVNATLSAGWVFGKIHFQSPTGCITKLNGSTASKCVPHTFAHPSGLIETGSLTGTLELHWLKDATFHELIGVRPTAGPFVELILGTGECAIGSKIEITGTIFLKDAQGELLVDKVEHLFEEGPLSALLFGGNSATLDGSAFWFLGFPKEGSTWAGHV